MNDFARISAAVTEYVRDYIRALRRRKLSYQKIGQRLQISHVWVMQLDKPQQYGKRNAGPELEYRLAELLHGGSIDALRKAALHLASGGNVVVEHDGMPLELSPSEPNSRTAARRPAKAR